VGWDFVPFAINPWGALGAKGFQVLKTLLHQATEQFAPDVRGLKKAEFRGLVALSLQSQVSRQLRVVYDAAHTQAMDLPLTSIFVAHPPDSGSRMEVDQFGNEIWVPT
jgi:hypothetical protein